MTRHAILALALTVLATPALGQTKSTTSGADKSASAMTQKFVKNAAITDMFLRREG